MAVIYSVKYKKRGWFRRWHTIKKVKGDGIWNLMPYHRFFITDKEERIEIPMPETIFKFSTERFFAIKEQMEADAKQQIKVNTEVK